MARANKRADDKGGGLADFVEGTKLDPHGGGRTRDSVGQESVDARQRMRCRKWVDKGE